MGRFSPFMKVSVEVVEGGDYELTERRLTWGCHDVVA